MADHVGQANQPDHADVAIEWGGVLQGARCAHDAIVIWVEFLNEKNFDEALSGSINTVSDSSLVGADGWNGQRTKQESDC